jgi:methyl-accepting chemotaxis protein
MDKVTQSNAASAEESASAAEELNAQALDVPRRAMGSWTSRLSRFTNRRGPRPGGSFFG